MAAAVAVLSGMQARAADLTPEETAKHADWDVAFGVTFTSDYISRGYTQSDHNAAIQPWAELDIGKFYLGYWGSNVVLDDDRWEHDLSIGVRPSLGPVDFDLGYVRYLYDSSGDCCGELYAKASFSPVDPLTLGGNIYYDPEASNTYVEATGSFDLPHDLSVSGTIGLQSYGDGSASDTSWNAGIGWSPYEWLTLDARYHGGPTAERFVVSLSLSSSLKTLSGMQ
jgi:uncharacterized protein (TIGR02001 family)